MSAVSAAVAVRTERLDEGRVRRLILSSPKGNVLGKAVVDAAREAVREAVADAATSVLVLSGDAGNFSFGASVEEHLPGEAEGMLARLHGLFLELLDSPLVLVAAVEGRCLGGGLELASLCHRVVAHPAATLGQPEIALGVFAPFASAFLSERVGRAAADDLCLTGRVVRADEARAIGLVDEVADDPHATALEWARKHFAPRSTSSVRYAVQAARVPLLARLRRDLAAEEKLFLDCLLRTEDAGEGLRAFLEKRAPTWRGR